MRQQELRAVGQKGHLGRQTGHAAASERQRRTALSKSMIDLDKHGMHGIAQTLKSSKIVEREYTWRKRHHAVVLNVQITQTREFADGRRNERQLVESQIDVLEEGEAGEQLLGQRGDGVVRERQGVQARETGELDGKRTRQAGRHDDEGLELGHAKDGLRQLSAERVEGEVEMSDASKGNSVRVKRQPTQATKREIESSVGLNELVEIGVAQRVVVEALVGLGELQEDVGDVGIERRREKKMSEGGQNVVAHGGEQLLHVGEKRAKRAVLGQIQHLEQRRETQWKAPAKQPARATTNTTKMNTTNKTVAHNTIRNNLNTSVAK